MRIVVAGGLPVVVAVGLWLASEPASEPAPAPDDLGQVALCESFVELETRLTLKGIVPLLTGEDRRYILDTTRPLSEEARRHLRGLSIERMELVVRNDRVVLVKVEYKGRHEAKFAEVEQELSDQYGAPDGVRQEGPMQIGRRHGIRLYLWLRVWAWEWADRSLTVEGRYYSVHEEERPADHEYIFKLEDADRECPPI